MYTPRVEDGVFNDRFLKYTWTFLESVPVKRNKIGEVSK